MYEAIIETLVIVGLVQKISPSNVSAIIVKYNLILKLLTLKG